MANQGKMLKSNSLHFSDRAKQKIWYEYLLICALVKNHPDHYIFWINTQHGTNQNESQFLKP